MSQWLIKSNFTVKVKVAKASEGKLGAVAVPVLSALLDNSPRNGQDCPFIRLLNNTKYQ